jgi:hypothetical protein
MAAEILCNLICNGMILLLCLVSPTKTKFSGVQLIFYWIFILKPFKEAEMGHTNRP